jgi:pyridoxine 5-phosphate synthase
VHDLAALLKDWPQAEYNIEGNPFHNLMDFVRAVRPHQVTFVPDSEGSSPATMAGTWPPTATGCAR